MYWKDICKGRVTGNQEAEKAIKTKSNVEDGWRGWLLLNPYRELESQRTARQLSTVIPLHIGNLV